jgi:membrane-bound lytic murein transglycosylase B
MMRESLAGALTNAGFDRTLVLSLLTDSRWTPSLRFLEKNLIFRESPADYSHFLSQHSLDIARDFIGSIRDFLVKTEGKYGVQKEVIVAILLIESACGLHTGKHGVFNAFSSLSQASHPEVFRLTCEYVKGLYSDVTEEYLKERARIKSQWAFHELEAFLAIGIREGFDILDVRGSWSGAFGMPQFIPTSYLRYGVDGSGDNRVYLNDRYDAIASVANYLKANGWRPGLKEDEKRKVLFQYNRSDLYGQTVLECARRLKAQRSPLASSH